MNNDQITALAREYAEEIYPHEDGEDLGQMEFLRTSATKHIEASLKMLTRRFCLVEKERVKDEYHEAKFTCGNVDPCSDTFVSSLAQKSVLEYLFPELGKEVEG